LLPSLDLLVSCAARRRATLARGAALGLGTLLGASPQLLAWKALYGEYLLRYPPHGADFLRLDHPFLLETFFSSRHGLLAWTPALWLGYPRLRASLRTAAAAGAGARGAARRDELRQRVLGRLVGRRLVLEPPLRQPAADLRVRHRGGPRCAAPLRRGASPRSARSAAHFRSWRGTWRSRSRRGAT
jgi:hypothetical protein